METPVAKISKGKIVRVNDKIDLEKIASRSFDVHELFNALKNNQIVWSWGANHWTYSEDKVLMFRVQGHHLKGSVFITLAWDDTFTIYYTDKSGKIITIHQNIYIDELINTIDVRVEKIESYNF